MKPRNKLIDRYKKERKEDKIISSTVVIPYSLTWHAEDEDTQSYHSNALDLNMDAYYSTRQTSSQCNFVPWVSCMLEIHVKALQDS